MRNGFVLAFCAVLAFGGCRASTPEEARSEGREKNNRGQAAIVPGHSPIKIFLPVS
jgi:hypothetical protein